MHRIYVAHGLDPDGFWQITPREMVARLDGARRRLIAEQDGRAWLAWHIAALTRQTKLPDLSGMFTQEKRQEPQTPEQVRISVDQLFLAWGGDPAQLAQVRAAEGAS
ncbi:MAG: hypothetical protein EpisKO_05820 [Epibacterium sp.]